MPLRLALVLGLVPLVLPLGCSEAYCQSGPKYGTQCYSRNDIEWQETQVRGETVAQEPAPQPAPGCVVGAGFTSMACIPSRQPAPGAVR